MAGAAGLVADEFAVADDRAGLAALTARPRRAGVAAPGQRGRGGPAWPRRCGAAQGWPLPRRRARRIPDISRHRPRLLAPKKRSWIAVAAIAYTTIQDHQ
jgi:hypothetical protein